MTWKAGKSVPPSVNGFRILDTSRKLPGPCSHQSLPDLTHWTPLLFVRDWISGRKPTAMAKQQWYSALDLTLLVREMDVQRPEAIDMDLCMVLWDLVDRCFLRSPVIAISPVLGQSLDVRQGRSIVPAGIVELVRESDCR